ncbi:GNAT family N-acetyltransferase [Halostella sp. JP-L12]|uniref:arsenic resistance N-acetyltransferase ArsN2 n=1 Tax=Halostella TaxID=1843185 RepID=UPI000EF8148C|nr:MULTISPECIES: arsenic resistance N-acetyltransferase ArsN2 [Halostella]NHN48098.1 GNAT family N-acetyltransferase [Halostella sp. JP-L12]
MTDSTISLRRADPADLDRAEALLAANDFPHRDVRTDAVQLFVAESGSEFVGVGGLEPRGSNALLRSVVVAEPCRGKGYGAELCAALEERARTEGIDELYLLTTTAAAFFRRNGYETIDRESAPPRIRRTTQFEDLCPDSAVCMTKSLDG